MKIIGGSEKEEGCAFFPSLVLVGFFWERGGGTLVISDMSFATHLQ